MTAAEGTHGFQDFGPGALAILHGVDRPKADERAPDFLWSGRPVYRCRVCGDRYERVENLAAVLEHEAEQHGSAIQPSRILGVDGKPLLVREE